MSSSSLEPAVASTSTIPHTKAPMDPEGTDPEVSQHQPNHSYSHRVIFLRNPSCGGCTRALHSGGGVSGTS